MEEINNDEALRNKIKRCRVLAQHSVNDKQELANEVNRLLLLPDEEITTRFNTLCNATIFKNNNEYMKYPIKHISYPVAPPIE